MNYRQNFVGLYFQTHQLTISMNCRPILVDLYCRTHHEKLLPMYHLSAEYSYCQKHLSSYASFVRQILGN